MAFPSKEKGRDVFAALKASGWESVRLVLSQYWVRLIGLNLLYLLCCLPVITIPAATCGLHRVILNMVRETRYEGVFHGFFAEFRTHFLKRTVFGLLLLLAPASIACYPIIFGMEGSAVVITTTISVLLYFCITKYFYPLLVLLDVDIWANFKNACIMAVVEWRTTLQLLITAGLLDLMLLLLPIRRFRSISSSCARSTAFWAVPLSISPSKNTLAVRQPAKNDISITPIYGESRETPPDVFPEAFFTWFTVREYAEIQPVL